MARETYQNLRSARWFAREELCNRAASARADNNGADSNGADWVKRNMTRLYEAGMSGTSYGASAMHVAQTDKGCDFDLLTSETGHPVPELEIN